MNPYKKHFVRMAIYSRWAYRQLFDKLDEHISDEKYYDDTGLFFRSIHGTLVHLLLGSKLWYARLTEPSSNPLNNDHYQYEINSYWSRNATDWEQAVTERHKVRQSIFDDCNRWILYINELDEQSLINEQIFSYLDTDGYQCQRDRFEALDHVFNHMTHHRGQITAVLTKLGGQSISPVLDLSAMPVEEYEARF